MVPDWSPEIVSNVDSSYWHWILQAAIVFCQITYTSHADIWYANIRQSTKTVKQGSIVFISLDFRQGIAMG